jgi:hypothetical protein
MTNNTLTVYGNQGKVKYPANINDENISIRSAWSAKRRFIAKNNEDGNIIQCFARMHTGRHEEQLYLEFRYQNARNVFEEFTQAINNQLINGQGWKLIDHKTNRYINTIMNFGRSGSSNLPLSEIEMLVDDGQDVTTFTSDATNAILLAHETLTRGYDVTIADKKDSLKYCDVGVHVATKYPREINLSQDNKEYYRREQQKIKRKQLREPLEESVQNIKSELGQDTFVSMLEDVLSDTEYELRLSGSESESQSPEHSTFQQETKTSRSYSSISYGLNAVAGIIALLYIISEAIAFTGSSFSELVGTPFEILAVFVSAFLLGYGSLGAIWVISDLSKKEIEVLSVVSLALSGVIYYLVGVGPLRESFPAVIGGFSWWITLSVVPLLVGLAGLATTDIEVLESETESTDSFDINSPTAVPASVGMLLGVLLGNYVLRVFGTYLVNISIATVAVLVIMSAAGIVTVVYFSRVEKYRKILYQVGITAVTFGAGLAISGSLVQFGLVPQLQNPIIKLPVGVISGLCVYRLVPMVLTNISAFDEEDGLSIQSPVSEDGDPPLVQGPDLTVELLNDTYADWVTLKLTQDNQIVDTEELPSKSGDPGDNLIGTLRAAETGRHTIKAHTGQGGFSGHDGGREKLDITVQSIEDTSSAISDQHAERGGQQGQSIDTGMDSPTKTEEQSLTSDSNSCQSDSDFNHSEPTEEADDTELAEDSTDSRTASDSDSESEDDGWSGLN